MFRRSEARKTLVPNDISSDIRQIPKQPAAGREQTPMVFRANGQKARRSATSCEYPQLDEDPRLRNPCLPATQESAVSRQGPLFTQSPEHHRELSQHPFHRIEDEPKRLERDGPQQGGVVFLAEDDR